MVTISIEYEGGLRCTSTHGPSQKKLQTDAPVDNHGKGESFSPTDLVATALGSCMATVMGIAADRHQIDLKGMKIEVVKEMSTDSPRRIVRLPVKIWMPISEQHPQKDFLEKTALACPVHQSLHPDIDKTITFFWKKH